MVKKGAPGGDAVAAMADKISRQLAINLDEAIRNAISNHLGTSLWEIGMVKDRCKFVDGPEIGVRVFSIDGRDMLKVFSVNPDKREHFGEYAGMEQRPYIARFTQRIVKLY